MARATLTVTELDHQTCAFEGQELAAVVESGAGDHSADACF